ncbi:MAG TPA: S1 RNA-binding domain-containing protein, partial [Methanosarcinales archaeon]|nr:S1 RNA-binding domain-containing protein [Methanosarcinales archaeon]
MGILSNLCDVSDLCRGEVYEGSVSGIVDFGAFVDLNNCVRGLIHSSNMSSEIKSGDVVQVRVKSIKSNGNIELIPEKLKEYQIIEIE